MEIKKGKRLLLVEDEAIIAMVTAKMLKQNGYDVKTVSDGRKAVETALSDSSIDLILMDIDLGQGINGPGAARQILQMRNLPIVFLTSHSEQNVVEMVKEITRYGYVIKNSGDFVLLSSIEMAFELFESHERLRLSAEYLRESEARLNDVTANMADLVSRLDAEGFFEYVSPSYERILGYRPDELIGTWPPEIFHPAKRDKNISDIRAICYAGEGSAEFRLRHKDGTYRWFEATGRNVYDENGVVAGAVLGARDITEKKAAEKKLSKKDKQYKELFESMIDGFALHEIVVDDIGLPVDYIFLEVNPAFEQLTGLNSREIIGKRVSEIMPDIEPYWIATYGQVAFTGVQLAIENFSVTLNKWFKVTAYSSERGFFATIFEDITDRKRGEDLLKERDDRYMRLFESVVGYVYTVYLENKNPVRTVHGPGCEAITGYTPDDFNADPELWYKMIYPDDRGRVILFASDIISKGVFTPVEHRIICRDGSLSWVRNTPVPHYDGDNKLMEYDSIIADITQRKETEISLYESEARYRLIVDKNPLSIFLVRNGKFIFANPAGTERLGYKSSGDIIGMDIEKAISAEDLAKIGKRMQHAIDGEANPPIEMTFIRADGVSCPTESTSFPIVLSDGNAILVMGRDVTELRIMEKEIIEKEFKFSSLTESSSAGIYLTDKDGDCVYANRSWLEMTGLTMDEAKGQGWMKALHPEDRATIGEKWYKSVKSNGHWGYEYRFLKQNGELVWVNGTAAPINNADGELTGYVGTNINITEQKKAMESLSESENRFRNLFEHISVAYQALDSKGHFIDVNENWLQMTGYSRDEVIGRSFGEFWISETRDLFPGRFKKFLTMGFIDDAEIYLTKKNGETLTVLLTGRIQSGITGKFEKTHCIITDITERKRVEDEIHSLLKEKELLLGEVHHRIKNNMNTISGLLMLQAASMKDDAAVTALNDARSRVQSMMIMYDKLYRSEDYRKMSVKEYLEKFIDEIFMIFENSKQVKIEKNIEEFVLDTKILFPLGIIINEVITNAFKYAFPDGREGVIKISVKKTGEEITVSINDDGAGVPDEVVSSQSGGFGLNLVSALTEQLGGKFTIIKENGTTVEIVFRPGV